MVQVKQAASVLALSASALAATINVAVSSVFTPNSITAAEGDIIQFNFESQHSVVRSEFASPCVTASDNQIYSGTRSSGSFSVLVNSTDPLWLYCGFARHCQGGQVMVVNPPSSGDQTLEAYSAAAGSSGSSQNPDAVVGGVVGTADQIVASPSAASPSDASQSAASPSTASPSAATSSDASASETATPSTPAESSAAAASSSAARSSSAAAATKTSAANKRSIAGVAGFAGVFAAFLA